MRNLTVEIVRATAKQRFVGGYRSRVSGLVYLHAGVQTGPMRAPRDLSSLMRTRSTQTHALRHFVQQTSESTSTQMTGVGVYIPDLTDRLVAPRRYVTADEFLKNRAVQVDSSLVTHLYCIAHIARSLHFTRTLFLLTLLFMPAALCCWA